MIIIKKIFWQVTGDRWQVTGYRWHVTCDRWQVTCDMWHVTCDTWHMTHDTWHIVWDEHSFKILAPYFFRFGIKSVLKIFRLKDHWLTDSLTDRVNHKPVCRTASATPGLLRTLTTPKLGAKNVVVIAFRIALTLDVKIIISTLTFYCISSLFVHQQLKT